MSSLGWVLFFEVGLGSGIKLSGTSPSGFGSPTTSLITRASQVLRCWAVEIGLDKPCKYRQYVRSMDDFFRIKF